MKKLIFSNLFAIALLQISAQSVVKTDVVALLGELAAPPLTTADAYQRVYPAGATSPNTDTYYQTWMDKVNKAALENQAIQKDFYMKYPTGVRPQVKPVAASRVTPQQQSSMDAATSELAQKMLSDPEFAKKFSQMSEKEQHAYIANLLAEKGLKPVSGAPNVENAPVPGTDVEWIELCNHFTLPALDMSRWEVQTALQQKYQARHDEVNAWAEAEIKKLPTFVYGEYGRDHDPEQVKAVRKQALVQHRDVAEAMLKEAAPMFAQFRKQLQERMVPLNDALKKVNYGAAYDFGINYTTVLSAQAMMFGELQNTLTNEATIFSECAHWEYELRNFK